MRSMDTFRNPMRLVPVVLFGCLSVAVLLLFSGWNKPLLYDEFVYFAAGGLPDTRAALATVWETTTNVNQGVTGAFLMTDFWLLQLFGAQAEALRFPGLFTGVLLFAYSAVFLVGRGLSYWVLPAIPLAFSTQELVLRYVGEARTYMPLAAASVGVLAYYSLPTSSRCRGIGRLVGWSAVILGAIFHPYFILYLFALLSFSYVMWGRQRSVREFVNAPLVAVGLITYSIIGALTWMRGKANADVDPFNFLPGPLPVEIVAQNLYFIAASPVALISLVAVLLLPLTISRLFGRPLQEIWHVSVPPMLLAAIALALSLLISASTIINDFWIFPRQWVASTALVCLASVWLVAEWWRLTSQGSVSTLFGHWRTPALLVSSVALVLMAVPSITTHVSNVLVWGERPVVTGNARLELIARLEAGDVLSDAEWTSYAQRNIDVGGQVWEEFGNYYTDTDWTKFILTDNSG